MDKRSLDHGRHTRTDGSRPGIGLVHNLHEKKPGHEIDFFLFNGRAVRKTCVTNRFRDKGYHWQRGTLNACLARIFGQPEHLRLVPPDKLNFIERFRHLLVKRAFHSREPHDFRSEKAGWIGCINHRHLDITDGWN